MDCPNCRHTMRHVKHDISSGDNYKKYDRDQYRCLNDDVWVTVEVPVEEEEK